MSMNDFLWGVLPYIILTVFIGGHLYRYQKDQFGWSAKSSEFLEKKRLRIGSQLFHWGIILVFGGHVMGLIIPIGVYNAMGISEHFYHNIAITFGIPAGIAAFAGLAMLSYRRISVSRIKATTSTSDWLSLLLLLLAVVTGLTATGFNIDSNGFDYRTTIAPWLRGLFVLNIQPELMANIPIGFKIHILATFALYAVWPFTRLVHVFSFPLRYLKRSYVIYKRRVPEKQVN